MFQTIVRVSLEAERTRVLATRETADLCKAVLPPLSMSHARGLPTLLEGLSLVLNERLCVVLCVDEGSTSFGSCDLLDGLGYGRPSVFYEVGVAAIDTPERRRVGRRLRSPGCSFRDLRALGWEGAR